MGVERKRITIYQENLLGVAEKLCKRKALSGEERKPSNTKKESLSSCRNMPGKA
jgi:hypothetical protein